MNVLSSIDKTSRMIYFEKYYPNSTKILIRKFEGKVEAETIIASWKYLLNNNLITTETIGVVNDITNCALNMNRESFSALMNFLKSNERLQKLKLAVVCDNPKNIIFPTIASVSEKELNVKPFASKRNAISWIED